MPYKSGKRKKSRTHKDAVDTNDANVPKSFVVRRGKTDTTVKELVRDLRQVMLPHTAERLRERKSNTLKDFVSVAGTLHVSHLLLFSQTEQGNVNLRIGRLPRGPTVTFRVEQYTTTRLVRSHQKHPADVGLAFEHPPLVVLHNFGAGDAAGAQAGPSSGGVSAADALRMVQVTFQAMFPALNPATIKLDHCRRVFLVHYAKATGRLELRHYLVRAVPVGVSRGVRKLAVQSKLPDLSRLEDVSSFVLNGGRTRGGATSDSEAEDEFSRVVLPQSFGGHGNVRSETSALKLVELGPRMSMSLVKIEGGMCEGDVLFHAFVSKTDQEAAALREKAAKRVQLKADRKATQAANVEAKAKVESARQAAKVARKQAQQVAAKKAAASGALGDDDFAEQNEGEDGYENDDDNEESVDESDEDDGHEERGRPAAVISRDTGHVDVGDSVQPGDVLDDEDEDEELAEEDDAEEEKVEQKGRGASAGIRPNQAHGGKPTHKAGNKRPRS